MIILIAILVLFTCYSLIILYYWRGWQSLPAFNSEVISPKTRISIIIPARNEEKNIGSLLLALNQQTYPRDFFEVIVIDDHSTDQTVVITEQFHNVKLIRLNEAGINSYKKKAIETGIAASSGDLILTTDADCLPPPEWLQTIASFKKDKEAILVVAPVVIDCNSSILQIFQAMDFMVLQGITGAAVYKKHHSMCNGANLAYEKKAFYEVNGFEGIDSIASGDDMLLMHKIAKRNADGIHYLKSKDAIVSTAPMYTWNEFLQQRIRWASKAGKYEDKSLFPVLLLVYLFNLSFIVLLIAGFWNDQYWLLLLALWILKTLVELPLFFSVADFFNKRWAIQWFPLFQPLHIFYTIIAGLLGQVGSYKWKGRKVR